MVSRKKMSGAHVDDSTARGQGESWPGSGCVQEMPRSFIVFSEANAARMEQSEIRDEG